MGDWRRSAAGVSLLEAVVAMAIAALALGIAYPSARDVIDAARVRGASERTRGMLLDAQRFAERHRTAVLVRIEPAANRIELLSGDGRWQRSLALPGSLRVAEPRDVLEAVVAEGGALPDLQVAFVTADNVRAGFRTDPLDGTFESWSGGN